MPRTSASNQLSGRMAAGEADRECARCARLCSFRREIRRDYADYFAAPVPAFGDPDPELLIVGLAPGLHGANATGRPFTGDYAGVLLYQTLYEFGWSNQPVSQSADDALRLLRCRITNAVKCVPPQNKPTPQEIKTCNAFLRAELETLRAGATILALGSIAHHAVLAGFGLRAKDYPFGHAAYYELPTGHGLVASYHCSRYNTQTKRLTVEMFRAVFTRISDRFPPKRTARPRKLST